MQRLLLPTRRAGDGLADRTARLRPWNATGFWPDSSPETGLNGLRAVVSAVLLHGR